MLICADDVKRGYTIVELMVTILIVAILAVTVGVFFVRLLTIQEQEREQGYIRESITEICGIYADLMSVGSSIATSNRNFAVKYRQETGGVSMETGCVTRAAYLKSDNIVNLSADYRILGLRVLSPEWTDRYSRSILGDAALLPFKGDIQLTSSITPMRLSTKALEVNSESDTNLLGYVTTDAALGLLQVTAWYSYRNDNNEMISTNVTARRIVRLWNRK